MKTPQRDTKTSIPASTTVRNVGFILSLVGLTFLTGCGLQSASKPTEADLAAFGGDRNKMPASAKQQLEQNTANAQRAMAEANAKAAANPQKPR